jgi:hypothetical protein
VGRGQGQLPRWLGQVKIFDSPEDSIAGEIGIDGGDVQGFLQMRDYAESNEKTTGNLTVIATPPVGRWSELL